MENPMDFNKKMAEQILFDLKDAKNQSITLKVLEVEVRKNLGAVDSTFPREIKNLIEGIFSKIEIHQQNQYCSTLNTDQEGTCDETLPLDDLFDAEITHLENYLSN